jgi:hypothetical protein
VDELRKQCVLQACPLCRAELPVASEEYLQIEFQLYECLANMVESGYADWQKQNTSQRVILMEAQDLLTTITFRKGQGNKGFVDAQISLARIALAETQRRPGVLGVCKQKFWTQQAVNQVIQRWGKNTQLVRRAADQGFVYAQSILAYVSKSRTWSAIFRVSEYYKEAALDSEDSRPRTCSSTIQPCNYVPGW